MEEFIRPEIKTIKDYTPGKTVPGLIKLASNENPFGPSPKALKIISKVEKNLHIYPDQKSLFLREALSNKFGIAENCIIVGNGSDEIMQIAASTFLKPGEEVLIPTHTFSVYEFVARLLGGKPVFADFNAMAAAITPKTKMIFLCNPNNPTGDYINEKDLKAFLAKVPENILVVLDEAYADFAEAEDFPKSLALLKEFNNLLILRTFSKFYGLAGLRVGYGFAHADVVKYMFRAKLPFNVGRLAQEGAVAALSDKAFEEKTFKNNAEGKKYLYGELEKRGIEYKKTEANFIFINLKKSADQFFMETMKKGIIIRPLTSFGFPEAIRVSIGTKEQNKKFVQAL